MLIFAGRQSKSIKTSPRYIIKRSYKQFDPEVFVTAVQKISWLEVYLCLEMDEAVELFTKKLTNVLDDMAPM